MTATAGSDEQAPRTSAGWLSVPHEARAFQGHRAGIVSRFIAASIDLLVVVLVMVAGYLAWAATMFILNPRDFTFPSAPPISLLSIGGVVAIVYLAVSWTATGRSYGAHLMGLRVVNFRGQHMKLLAALVRAAFCVIFPVGLFWVVISRANRSLQDVALRTSVIYDWQMRPQLRGESVVGTADNPE